MDIFWKQKNGKKLKWTLFVQVTESINNENIKGDFNAQYHYCFSQ